MPVTKQTIAIIGAGGNMGSATARNIAGGNYRLLLFDSDPDQLDSLKDNIQQDHPEADFEIMHCPHECSWEADIIILAVSDGVKKEIVDRIRDVATQKIVISIVNPINEAISKQPTEHHASAAEKLQQWLPHSKVVIAFNTTNDPDIEQPSIDGSQADAFIAGDNQDALESVRELLAGWGIYYPIKSNFQR